MWAIGINEATFSGRPAVRSISPVLPDTSRVPTYSEHEPKNLPSSQNQKQFDLYAFS